MDSDAVLNDIRDRRPHGVECDLAGTSEFASNEGNKLEAFNQKRSKLRKKNASTSQIGSRIVDTGGDFIHLRQQSIHSSEVYENPENLNSI